MDFSNWTFNEFATIATVSLSLIAIIIAIMTARKTSQLSVRQIESIKEVAILQIETSLLKLDAELFNIKVNENLNNNELEKIDNELKLLRTSDRDEEESIKKLENEFAQLRKDSKFLGDRKFQLLDMKFKLERSRLALYKQHVK